MKDQYLQRNTLNKQQEERKEANDSSKININSTKEYEPIASRNKFKLLYTKPTDLKEDDGHTIGLHINSLPTQNTQRTSPVVK